MRVRWWRLLAVPVAGLLLVVGCSSGPGRDAGDTAAAPTLTLPPAAAPSPGAPGRLLGAVSDDSPVLLELARLDPVQLRPLPGPHLRVNGNWALAALAPDRSVAVLTNNDDAEELAVVGLANLRQLGTIRLPRMESNPAWVAAASFVGRSRLLLVRSGNDGSSLAVTLVDLAARRVLGQQRVGGQMLGWASLPAGLVLLLAPAASIGPTRVALVGADATVRTVTLDRIAGGYQRLSNDDSDPRTRQAVPGLAVDPAGRHAFVVTADHLVGAVDLPGLAIAYQQLSQPSSPLQRLASWLQPPAEAKEVNGPMRHALWLGDGLLAVSGANAQATPDGGFVELPSGLELVDTRTWTTHTLDPNASNAILAGGRLLAWGIGFRPDRNQGHGLTVYGPGQRRPVHLLGAQAVSWIQVNGNLAYLGLSEGNSNAYAVVDLVSNRVLRHAQGDLPLLFLPTPP